MDYIHGSFSLSDSSRFGKNVTIFGADMSSSVHVNNRKKRYLNSCLTQGLGNTTLTTEKKYVLNFIEQQRKFCLSLHYNGMNSYLLTEFEIYKFEAKDSEVNASPLYRVAHKNVPIFLWQ